MRKKYWKTKENLIKFFQEMGYLTYGSTDTKKTTYFYSKDEKVHVIKISITDKKPNDVDDNELTYLKNKVRDQINDSSVLINVYEIYLSDKFENNKVLNPQQTILIANSWEYLVDNLRPEFPQITNFAQTLEEEADSASMAKGDFNIDDVKSPEDQQKKVAFLNLQLRNGKSLGTMLIFSLFLAIPLVIAIVSLIILRIPLNARNEIGQAASLVFGATNYQLTVLGGQWWRVLTYGFSSSTNWIAIIMLLLMAWLSLKNLRLNEVMMGTKKILGTFFISYLLFGFFASVLSFNPINASLGIPLAIILGMQALNAGGSKTVLALTAKRQLFFPIILLIIISALDGQSGMNGVIANLTAFTIGGAVSMMFNYDYTKLNWRLILTCLIIIAIILIPIVMLLIPTYVPAVDDRVIYSLQFYLSAKFMNVDQANSIVDKIGWGNIEWSMQSDWIWHSVKF